MSTLRVRTLIITASAVGLLALSACAAGPGAAPTSTAGPRLEDAQPAAPQGPVITTGMVIDKAGDAQLCLGVVQESYPPQCAGVPVAGWSWEGLDGSETSGETTWGSYAVRGTFDGTTYTITDSPMMLALYDPMRPEDPTGGVDGATTDAELTRVQDDIGARLGTSILMSWPDHGYVWLQVPWDDGTLQQAMDTEYGDDVVIVMSAISEVG